MATRVELPKEIVKASIDKHTQSIRRAIVAATNPLIKQALQDELATCVKAADTITEVK